jgi:hypothetical protein
MSLAHSAGRVSTKLRNTGTIRDSACLRWGCHVVGIWDSIVENPDPKSDEIPLWPLYYQRTPNVESIARTHVQPSCRGEGDPG